MKYKTWLHRKSYSGGHNYFYIFPVKVGKLCPVLSLIVSSGNIIVKFGNSNDKDELIIAPENWSELMKKSIREADEKEKADIQQILNNKSHTIVEKLFK